MSKIGEYPYKPLEGDEIRLLTILPGIQPAPVQCSLSHGSLHSPATKFTALSYTWGDPKITRPVAVEGYSFEVTVNLFEALNHLRDESAPRTFWIDAVCINQKDVDERNKQVLRMRDIYSLAANVQVWLGKATGDDDGALSLVSALGDLVADTEFALPPPGTTRGEAEAECLRLFCSVAPEILKSLNWLFCRPWWTRVWIVQELSLARQEAAVVTCGNRTLPWRYYLIAAQATGLCWEEVSVIVQEKYPEVRIDSFNHGVRLLQCRRVNVSDPPYRLLELLHQHRDCQATDERDKVYGLLGMSGDGEDMGVIPDYKRKPPDVYRDLAQKHISVTGLLDIICACRFPRKFDDLPSWVPDWSTDQTVPGICINDRFCEDDNLEGSRSAQVEKYRAGGLSKARPTVSGDILSSHGFIFGSIVELGMVDDGMTNGPVKNYGMTDENGKSKSGIDIFDNWTNMLFESDHWAPVEGRYGGLDEAIDAFSRTIIANRNESLRKPVVMDPEVDDSSEIADDDDEHDTDDFGSVSDEDMASDDSSSVGAIRRFNPAADVGLTEEEFSACLEASWGKRLAIFDTGFVGIVPQQSQVGDRGCVLLGCSVPLVIRCGSSTPSTLLGESYVYGVTEGELIDGEDLKQFAMEIIEIS